MGRLTSDARHQAEQNIRTAMDRLLRGDIPPGGRCDLKTLAAQAGVNRTGFYPKDGKPGPWQHLASEFHSRLAALRDTGDLPDPRDAQIARLKADNTTLRQRITKQNAIIAGHNTFQQQATSQLTAQHEELQRLRGHLTRTSPAAPTPALTVLHTHPKDTQP